MENIYKERINNIRKLMEEHEIDVYYVPMADCHGSEYIGDHFKTIRFLSGFTGSAASMAITKDEARLWTDGRYFLQAEDELRGSDIILMKIGEAGVIKIEDYINEATKDGKSAGLDGNIVPLGFKEKLKGGNVQDIDLADKIWSERPKQKFSKIKIFEENAGESSKDKITRLRKELENISEKYIYILNALDDIAWLFNIRANDIECNPVAYAYAVVTNEDIYFFCEQNSLTGDAKKYFENIGVKIGDYNEFKKSPLTDFHSGTKKIIIDPEYASCAMCYYLEAAGYDFIKVNSPVAKMKAIKNKTEISNMKNAHIKDGIAVTKCMKWVKENAQEEINECDVADKVLEFRKEQEGFLQPSFATIAAYKENAAIVHYEPEEGQDKKLNNCGMLLLDSGGHYTDGTTDTTRTFILGKISEEEKKCFTLVAAAMLKLLEFDSRKAEGAFNGLAADEVARGHLKENGYNYNHGTGHGIGYVLNVHEEPPRISHAKDSCAKDEFLPGMVISNEPGIYIENEFGIRIENNMVTVKKEDDSGEYMVFENLTCVPIDIDGIDKKYLDDEDIIRLNNYNKKVYNALEKSLDDDTRQWLFRYTREI